MKKTASHFNKNRKNHRGVSPAQSRRLRANRKKNTNTGRKARQEVISPELLVLIFGLILFFIFAGLIASWLFRGRSLKDQADSKAAEQGKESQKPPVHVDPDTIKPDIKKKLLEVSEYNRPGIDLPEVRGVVIHYVQNPGSTADENRRYFANLAKNHDTKASSHFIVGLEGEILQLVPLDEIAYCSNDANEDTISIECCHPDKSGKFNDKTYASVVQLTAWLCALYNLEADDVIRHYDVTGKMCPRYYVKHEDAWEQFKKDVEDIY